MPYDLTRTRIADACDAALLEVRTVKEKQEEAQLAALRKNQEPPRAQPPSCHNPKWVAKLASILKDGGLEDWLRDSDVAAAHEDLAGPHLSRLRGWPEFKALQQAEARIDVRWTPKAVVRKDVGLVEVRAGRPRVVPLKDRLTWPEPSKPPDFQLELSLPWFLLASQDERERGMHDCLCYLGFADAGPVLRKPDICAHAATLARFGVCSAREASAVFHAQRHPSHAVLLREFGFDADTGRGSIWGHTGPQQQDLVQSTASRTRKRTVPTPNTSTEGEA